MDARTLIIEADSIASKKGLTQSEWSRMAGYAKNGQTVSRILSKGNCKVSTLINLLNAVDCKLVIKEDV